MVMITRVYLHKSEIRTMSIEYEWSVCTSSLCASPTQSVCLWGNFLRLLHVTSIAWECPKAGEFPAAPLCGPCGVTRAWLWLQIGILGPPGQQAPPPYPGQSPASQPVMQQPSTPMFVSPPPKTQRLLHSEAYLKYIEGLSAESNSISKWDQTLAGKALGSLQPVVFAFIENAK